MTDKIRFPLEDAQPVASDLVELLESTCERIQIAGSVRRQRKDVGDIELLCIPKSSDELALAMPDGLDYVLKRFIDQGNHFRLRVNHKGRPIGYGKTNKFLVHIQSRIPVDIFSTSSRDWGMALFIRTGPAEYIVKAMRRFRELGLFGHASGSITNQQGLILDCPDEQAVFSRLKWDYVEPEKRA